MNHPVHVVKCHDSTEWRPSLLEDRHGLLGGVVFRHLRQVGLPDKLVAGDRQVDGVVAAHLVLLPHAHGLVEVEVERLEEAEVHLHTLLRGELVQLGGFNHEVN